MATAVYPDHSPDDLRPCPGCGEPKPPDAYYAGSRNRKCKVCVRARVKKYNAAHRVERRAYLDVYCEEHREELREKSRQYYRDNKETLQPKNRAYYHAHKEEHREYQRTWRARNRERWQARHRQYREDNRETLRAYYLSWSEQNADHLKAYRQTYYDRNRDRILVQTRKYAREHLEESRLWQRLRTMRREARKRGAEGQHNKDEWLAVCARYDHRCLRCCQKLPLSQDHVQPLSRGGSDWIANIQPLCRPCNRIKATRAWDFRPLWDALVALEKSIQERGLDSLG